LQELTNFIAQRGEPKIIVFDEIDAIAPTRSENPALLMTSATTMDFLDRDNALLKGSIVFGITNNPDRVDPAVMDRLSEGCLYFDLPTEATISTILDDRGIPAAQQVARLLVASVGRNGHRITGRGASDGAETAQTFFRWNKSDVNRLPPQQIAEHLLSSCSSVDNIEFENFGARQRARIERASTFVGIYR